MLYDFPLYTSDITPGVYTNPSGDILEFAEYCKTNTFAIINLTDYSQIRDYCETYQIPGNKFGLYVNSSNKLVRVVVEPLSMPLPYIVQASYSYTDLSWVNLSRNTQNERIGEERSGYVWREFIISSGLDYTFTLGNYQLSESLSSILDEADILFPSLYPITYSATNSIVSGPSEAAVGDTVTVSAVPDNNYGITDAASQILVTNNDVAVSYNWNPTTNTITFTMPDPT